MSTIRDLTDMDFEGAIASSPVPILVDFWAPWCGPCKAIAPALEEIASAYAGRLEVVKVNADENPGTAARHGVRGLPMFAIFDRGRRIASRTGGATRAALEALIEGALE